MISGIKISPKKVALILVFVVLAISAASLTGQYVKPSFADNEFVLKVIAKLNLDKEVNDLPTWYQSSTLLISSLLLLVIGFARRELKDKDAKYWWLLSFIFLFLSLDEAVSIHEQMTLPLRSAFHLEGFLFLSWVIPAIFALVVFGVVFFRFLFRLPPLVRYLMIGSGFVYVAGAVGLEMVGANYMFLMNDPPDIGSDFTYATITTAEELFEMSGIVLFIYSLLSHLSGTLTAEKHSAETLYSDRDSVPSIGVEFLEPEKRNDRAISTL